jgi:succinoglycan biosynthesis transport protein ExoP
MNKELTFHGLLLILKRRRSIIAWVVSVCFLFGVIAAAYFFIKPSFRAVGEIEVQKSATDGLGLENLTNSAPEQADALEDSITLQTQATILRSNNLALKVIEDLGLEHTADFKPAFSPIGWALGLLTPTVAKDPQNATLENAPRRREAALRVFEKHLKVMPQSGTRLIDIQYTSADPKIAAAVVNDVAKSLVEYTLNSRYTATSQVSGLEISRKKLNCSRAKLSSSKKNPESTPWGSQTLRARRSPTVRLLISCNKTPKIYPLLLQIAS